MKVAHQSKLRELKQFDEDPEQWMKLWRKFPVAWKSLVRSADLGRGPIGLDQHAQSFFPEQCKCCLKNFKSLRSLGPHVFRVHGIRRPASPRCAPLALLIFTKGVAHHLSYSSKVCLKWAEENVAPQAAELVKELERPNARKSGRSYLAAAVPARTVAFPLP